MPGPPVAGMIEQVHGPYKLLHSRLQESPLSGIFNAIDPLTKTDSLSYHTIITSDLQTIVTLYLAPHAIGTTPLWGLPKHHPMIATRSPANLNVEDKALRHPAA